jgi:hypothetical protein
LKTLDKENRLPAQADNTKPDGIVYACFARLNKGEDRHANCTCNGSLDEPFSADFFHLV